eukprot:CAMPEP_0197543408 /NCGR_PEP_ID=MMETSP1318-20131121/68226_1 /TAXON_ID=552666 /ORGANISM="Partenskyella glossopodia, Strain RCC365" /LENGTH=388 /DNA_ID=CAMNT_0043102745 /DNA_START=119 /DNA_END=1281 /DNA_ORIENTATION=-
MAEPLNPQPPSPPQPPQEQEKQRNDKQQNDEETPSSSPLQNRAPYPRSIVDFFEEADPPSPPSDHRSDEGADSDTLAVACDGTFEWESLLPQAAVSWGGKQADESRSRSSLGCVWPPGSSVSSSVFLDTRYNSCHLGILLTFRVLVAAWGLTILIWASHIATKHSGGRWALALTWWVLIMTVAYFLLASFYTFSDWVSAKNAVESLSFLRKCTVGLYEIAFPYSLVIFIVHVAFSPQSDGSGDEKSKSGHATEGAGNDGGVVSSYDGVSSMAGLALDLHLHYASFVWLFVDSVVNAMEFKASHVLFVFPLSIIYMVLSGINLYLWESPSDTDTRAVGLTMVSWAVLMAGAVAAFYILFAWSEAKYFVLQLYESSRGLRKRPDAAGETG